jgi:hypothetical protein
MPRIGRSSLPHGSTITSFTLCCPIQSSRRWLSVSSIPRLSSGQVSLRSFCAYRFNVGAWTSYWSPNLQVLATHTQHFSIRASEVRAV